MLIIRFSRVGKRNHAQYRIVLAEKSSPVRGRFVELLGSYDPHQKQAVLKEDRIKYWIGNGAQCSDTAFNLFVKEGLVEGEKREVKMPDKKTEEGDNENVEEESVSASFSAKATADKKATTDKEEEVVEKEEKDKVVENSDEKNKDAEIEEKPEPATDENKENETKEQVTENKEDLEKKELPAEEKKEAPTEEEEKKQKE
ncbi:MAG: 30S ribosomal protein S16 [Patescibacteria group bacterium]|jgi:small subunit ribosomal protein S16|nr:30S ribosomal protein S16 [Patescibacteria group bacterium]